MKSPVYEDEKGNICWENMVPNSANNIESFFEVHNGEIYWKSMFISSENDD